MQVCCCSSPACMANGCQITKQNRGINEMGKISIPVSIPGLPESRPHKCPICEGKGKIINLYPELFQHGEVQCHGCQGKGIVWG